MASKHRSKDDQKLGGFLFSISIVLITFLVLFLTDQFMTQNFVNNRLQDFISLSLSIFVEAFPFLVLGSLLASIVNTYVPPHTFEKFLPKKGIFRRASLSLLGFIFPVCECGNVPVSRSLMMQGLKPSEAVTFLLAAPVLNPVTIWSTWAAFNYDSSIVVSRIAATFVIANFIGYILSLKKHENDYLKDDFIELCENPEIQTSKLKNKVDILSRNFTKEAYIMIKMLAFGALIAGVIQSFVPRDILVSIGSNVLLSIVAMLLLAFVVSICANIDAFFALSFANTFTAGSIVSFLVFGPMIDIKMIALLKSTFKNNLIIIISVLSLLLSALTGLVVSYAF
jgi:uncharacterized membrane protein YraQ (UPF0718 family)